jgi:YggT family protein
MSALWLVIKTIGSLLATACVLRALAHRLHLSPYNPVSQFINAVTDWLVKPLRKLVQPTRNMDWASVIAALLLAVVVSLLFSLMFLGARMPAPGAVLLLAIGWLIEWSLHLLIAMLILQAVLSWVNPQAPMAPALNQLTDPFLAPFRKVIPLVGGVDLSPMVLILAIYVALELLQSFLAQIGRFAI